MNIASLAKHFEGLHQALASLKVKFDIIGITEHKIRKDMDPIINSDIDGYRTFLYDPTESTHGGTGFYISQSINFIKRDDFQLVLVLSALEEGCHAQDLRTYRKRWRQKFR